MTFWESLYLALVLAIFAGFGAVLAWTDHQFTKVKRLRPRQHVREQTEMLQARQI